VIQNLLGGRLKLSATCAHFIPAAFISVIELSRVLGSDQDDIALIGQVHSTFIHMHKHQGLWLRPRTYRDAVRSGFDR
jgi:hypothetical protein